MAQDLGSSAKASRVGRMEWAQKRQRPYVVCSHCHSSWVFEDRIHKGKVTQCHQCGQAWKATREPQKSWQKWHSKHQITPPPGLGKKGRGRKAGLGESWQVVQKVWGNLPDRCKDEFRAMGWDFDDKVEEPSMYDILKPHLDLLPDAARKSVEQMAGVPSEPTETDITKKLKNAVGQIREASAKKVTLQQKADQAKAQYKSLLEELKQITLTIEKAQQELTEVSKNYGSLLASTQPDEIGTPKAAEKVTTHMEVDPMTGYVDMLAEVGVTLSDEQKTQFEAKLAEQQKKKRRLGESGHCG